MNKINSEEQELLDVFCEQVRTGVHPTREWIQTLEQLNAIRTILADTKELCRLFNKLSNKLLKEYIKQRRQGIDDIALIFSSKAMLNCFSYYDLEIKILKLMIKEYIAYLNAGNLLNALIGIPRADEDMFCHLKKKVDLNSFYEEENNLKEEVFEDPFE